MIDAPTEEALVELLIDRIAERTGKSRWSVRSQFTAIHRRSARGQRVVALVRRLAGKRAGLIIDIVLLLQVLRMGREIREARTIVSRGLAARTAGGSE